MLNTYLVSNVSDLPFRDKIDSFLIQRSNIQNMALFGFGKPNIEKLKKNKDINRLIEALGNNDYWVRNEAALALGDLGDARAVDPLIVSLRRDPNGMVRMAAAAALGRLGDARAIGPLESAVTRDELPVQRNAEWALKQLR